MIVQTLTKEDVCRWREEFPILKNKVHLANCSQSPQSKRVRLAIDRYLDSWQNTGMDWEYWLEEVYNAKKQFAKIINANIDEIGISTSVSEIVSTIASSLDYTGTKRKVFTTEIEFPTVAHVWLAQRKLGCELNYIPAVNYQIDIDEYSKHIDDKTLLTSVTHVCYQNGFKQDLRAIADIVHQKGSLLLVDAYQSLGTTPIDVKSMDIDILVSGNLKYLLGIPGIAFIYVKKDLIPGLTPSVTGWFSQKNPFSFDIKKLDFANDARRFETGTPPILVAFAVGAGMSIINEVGVQAIADRIDMLSEFTIHQSQGKGFKVISPLDIKMKGAITGIEVPGDPHLIEEELAKRNIIVSARGNVIRIAPHFFTTQADISRTLDELEGIVGNKQKN